MGLTDPVDRVKVYRQKDYDEEAERLRRVRWNLIKDTGPINPVPRGEKQRMP